MKNLEALVTECREDIESLGMKLGNIKEVTINKRAKKRWGQCSRNRRDNTYTIQISNMLLSDDVPDEAAKNTIAHELLHALDGGVGLKHTGEWLRCAKLLNEVYGYNIKRTTSFEEKGIAYDTIAPIYKYTLCCTNCGLKARYTRFTKMLKHISNGNTWRYECSRCKTGKYLEVHTN